MRRSVLAVALLLATAPVAGATEILPDARPELRAVEGPAPAIRTNVVVAPARSETTSEAAARRRALELDTTTIIIVVLAAIGVIAILGAL